MRSLLSIALLLGALATASFTALACSSPAAPTDDADAGDQLGDPTDDNSNPSSSDNSSGDPAPSGNAGTGLATGLPCDVQALLENRCIGCHSNAPDSPSVPLLTYDNLNAKSKVDPSKTVAQESLVRMQNKASPMPPPPADAPTLDEVATMNAWVMKGAPRYTQACTDTPPPSPQSSDAGVASSEGGTTTGTCTSGKMWTSGNQGSLQMNPGMACNACHQKQGGPNLSFGGTVYLGQHDVDLCDGTGGPPGLNVIITDKNGNISTLPVDSSGNFQLPHNGNLKAPFRARVTNGMISREMMGSVTSGDCNSCHTAAGVNNAPGRILAPPKG